MQSNNKNLSVSTKSPLALAIAAAVTGAIAQPAFALSEGNMCSPVVNTYEVTSSLGDTSDNTLGAAILLANADGGCSQIEFDESVTSVILEQASQITEELNLVGHGKDSLTLSSTTGNTIHATDTAGALHVSNLKISNSPSAGIYQKYGALTVDNVILDTNGTGIYPDSTFDTVIRNSTIGNSVFGGGIYFQNNDTGATLLIDKSDISNNQASASGGGLHANIQSQADIQISESTFSGNTTYGAGGAIHIQAEGATSINIEDSSIDGNSSNNQGGGINVVNNTTDIEFNIKRSSITNNTAGHNGGGIRITNSGSASGNFIINQSTLSTNTANGNYGGGIYFDDDSSSPATLLNLLLESSTLIDNTAAYKGGGIYHFGTNDDIAIKNSVIAQNTANSGYMNLSGVFNSLEYSWVGDNNGDLAFATDPTYTNAPTSSVIEGDESTLNLGDLADNGGPTQTHLPLADSPLLEAGNPATADLPATDQRGSTREVGTLDIGAVELNTTPNLDISQATGDLSLDLGETFNIDISAVTTNTDVTIDVSGLPEWLLFDSDTSIISGLTTETGALELGITLSNFDESATATLDLYVKMNPPSVDTAVISNDLNIVTGESVNIDISSITSDNNVTFTVSGLPTGLSFDTDSKTITGIATQGGNSPLVITVSNTDYATEGNANLIAVTNTPVLTTDSITDNLSIATGETAAISIDGISDIDNVTFAVSGLPEGFEFNTETNTINGSSNVSGTFELVISVTHFDVTTTKNVNLLIQTTIPALNTESLSSALNIVTGETAVINIGGISDIDDVTFSVSGLPEGFEFNTETNTINGSSNVGGTFELVINVTHFDVNVTKSVILSVLTPVPNINIDNISGDLTITTGDQFNIDISQVSNINNSTLSVSGLPEGLSFQTDTSIISGSLNVSSAFEVTISAQYFDATTTRTINLNTQTPVPTLSTDQIDSDLILESGQALELNLDGISDVSGVMYEVTGLPDGLEFNTDTATISGTSTESGNFDITITGRYYDETVSVNVELVVEEASTDTDSESEASGIGAFSFTWLLMFAGIFIRRKR